MGGVSGKDHSEDLRLVLQPLENTGIPVQTWTTTELARHFITTESFIANVKTITLISSDIVRDNVMSLAFQCGFWPQRQKCTPMTMMKFCNFLKSKEGSQILDDIQKKAAFSSMHVRINNMVYPWMLSQSIREDARERWIEEIEWEIKNQYCWIVMLEKKQEKGYVLVQSRDRVPASQYVLLDEQELLKRCYNMYVAETNKSEEKVKELDQELIEFIKSKYEVHVRMAHAIDFMADEKRRVVLKVWTDERNKTDRV